MVEVFCRHAGAAACYKGGVVPLADEPGVPSHQNIVIIREVLAHTEALKTIWLRSAR